VLERQAEQVAPEGQRGGVCLDRDAEMAEARRTRPARRLRRLRGGAQIAALGR